MNILESLKGVEISLKPKRVLALGLVLFALSGCSVDPGRQVEDFVHPTQANVSNVVVASLPSQSSIAGN